MRALEDLLDQKISTETAKIAALLLVEGVKVGGVYRHWKGVDYVVTGVSRDADDWKRFRVEYCEVGNALHRASRFLEEFLGNHPNGSKMFVLVK